MYVDYDQQPPQLIQHKGNPIGKLTDTEHMLLRQIFANNHRIAISKDTTPSFDALQTYYAKRCLRPVLHQYIRRRFMLWLTLLFAVIGALYSGTISQLDDITDIQSLTLISIQIMGYLLGVILVWQALQSLLSSLKRMLWRTLNITRFTITFFVFVFTISLTFSWSSPLIHSSSPTTLTLLTILGCLLPLSLRHSLTYTTEGKTQCQIIQTYRHHLQTTSLDDLTLDDSCAFNFPQSEMIQFRRLFFSVLTKRY